MFRPGLAHRFPQGGPCGLNISVLLSEPRTGVLPPSRWFGTSGSAAGPSGPHGGRAGGISPRGSPLWVAPRWPILGACWDGPVLLSEPRTGVLPASRWFRTSGSPAGPPGLHRGGRGGPPGLSPADSAAPVLPGCLLGPAWDIPVLLSDTAHKLATLIYTMLRYGQEYVDAGAEYHDRSSRWRWLARPVVNSGRRTGRLSHPASAAVVSVPVAASPFSPGGAARFCFYTCPRPRTGLSGPRLCPRAGGSVPGVSGAASGPSSGPSGGNPRGSSGPPARRSHAPLPVPAAGGGFAGFSGGAAVFRGLSAIFRRLPAVPPGPFAPFSRISPVWPPEPRTGVLPPLWRLHAPEAAGASSASLVARRGRFPVAPDRLSPAARPSLSTGFLPPIYKGKKILFPL